MNLELLQLKVNKRMHLAVQNNEIDKIDLETLKNDIEEFYNAIKSIQNF